MGSLDSVAARLAAEGFHPVRVDSKHLHVGTADGPLVVQHDGPIFVVSRVSAGTKVTRICEDEERVLAAVKAWRHGPG